MPLYKHTVLAHSSQVTKTQSVLVFQTKCDNTANGVILVLGEGPEVQQFDSWGKVHI